MDRFQLKSVCLQEESNRYLRSSNLSSVVLICIGRLSCIQVRSLSYGGYQIFGLVDR